MNIAIIKSKLHTARLRHVMVAMRLTSGYTHSGNEAVGTCHLAAYGVTHIEGRIFASDDALSFSTTVSHYSYVQCSSGC